MDVAAFHRSGYLADAHADTLMWNRGLTWHQRKGHVDLPRLREAGVRLQCFTVVSEGFPWINGFGAFTWWRRYPPEARRSPWSRGLFQIERLRQLCGDPHAGVRLATAPTHLAQNFGDDVLSAVLGIEGAQLLGDDVAQLDTLARLGARFIGPVHLNNNRFAGSSFPGMGNKPLTLDGEALLERCADLGLSVDVAHASPATLEGIFANPRIRPLCSHTGVRGAFDRWRNLDDGALRTLASRGGVVGIIFGTGYLGGREFADVVRHIRHALDIMGEDAVGLGSDFDGMVPLPRGMKDVTGLPLLTQALCDAKFPPRIVEKVMGLNWRRFFEETLPRDPGG